MKISAKMPATPRIAQHPGVTPMQLLSPIVAEFVNFNKSRIRVIPRASGLRSSRRAEHTQTLTVSRTLHDTVSPATLARPISGLQVAIVAVTMLWSILFDARTFGGDLLTLAHRAKPPHSSARASSKMPSCFLIPSVSTPSPMPNLQWLSFAMEPSLTSSRLYSSPSISASPSTCVLAKGSAAVRHGSGSCCSPFVASRR